MFYLWLVVALVDMLFQAHQMVEVAGVLAVMFFHLAYQLQQEPHIR